EPEFIDRSPSGLGSSLSFFSDKAFHYYLPAYLLADIDEKLERQNIVFHLTYGLTDDTRSELANPNMCDDDTLFDEATSRFAAFNGEESAAIVAYLRYKAQLDEYDRDEVDQALQNYWLSRAS